MRSSAARARSRNHPSGPEARQRARFRRRPTEDPRLRHRARNGTRRRFDPANRPREQLLGTVPYMSPERLRGVPEEVDARSDIYAMGVMFYRLMAGRLPFDVRGITLLEAAQRILRAEVPPLGSVDSALAGSIEQVAKRSMSPDREQRYQSAADLVTDLRACLEGRALTQSHTAQRVTAAPAVRPLMAESDDHRIHRGRPGQRDRARPRFKLRHAAHRRPGRRDAPRAAGVRHRKPTRDGLGQRPCRSDQSRQ